MITVPTIPITALTIAVVTVTEPTITELTITARTDMITGPTGQVGITTRRRTG